MNVTTRKLSQIRLDSSYLRIETDVGTLKQSIRSVGLIHPLSINPDNELLAGARRYQAVKELGWEEVPVQVIDRDALVQELLSIDENLVRAPLTSLELEQCLNRGRELYEQLNPEVHKVDLSSEDLTPEEKAEAKQREEEDEDSFAAVTAEKTGLSRAVIRSAIKRDELASDAVKRARSEGALDATKTNEIIKLDEQVQAEVLPLITDKTAKEARRIVAAARDGGVEAALAEAETVVPMPREFRQMISPVKKVNRTIARILLEDLRYDGPEQQAIHGELLKLREHLDAWFARADGAEGAGAGADDEHADDHERADDDHTTEPRAATDAVTWEAGDAAPASEAPESAEAKGAAPTDAATAEDGDADGPGEDQAQEGFSW